MSSKKQKNSLNLEEMLSALKSNRDTYERFTTFSHQEIENFLKESGAWYQTVQSRTKSEESLTRKFKSGTVKVKNLSDIRDLSGVRVITYIDGELNKVQDAVWWSRRIGKLKVHKWERKYRDPGFIGIFLTLTPDESALSELPSEFADLKCELQLTTILQHGWSEVYHHSIRSGREDLKDFSPEQLSAIEKRYEELVKGPLREVADNIHFLYKEAGELKKGVEYKLDDPVELIPKATNLNEFLDGVKAVEDAIDKFGSLLPKLVRSLPLLVSYRALIRSLPTKPRIVSGYEFEASSARECLRKLLEVTRSLGYTDIECFLGFLVSIWREEPNIRSECEAQLREFLRWDVKILRAWGYAAHAEIVAQLDELFDVSSDEDWKFFLLSAEHLLSFQLQGAWETGLMTFAIPTGCVRVDGDLISIRSKAIEWLLKISATARSSSLRLHALRSLFGVLHCPFSPSGSIPSANELVLKESRQVIEAFKSNILSRTFSDMLIIFEGCRDLAHWYEREGLSTQHVNELIAVIEADTRFIRFQRLVGKSKFSGNFAEYTKWKEERIASARLLAQSVDESSWREWKDFILEVSSLQSDLGTEEFEPFTEFLKTLSERQPTLVSELVEQHVETLGRFGSTIIFELLERGKEVVIGGALLEHLKSGRAVLNVAYGIAWSKQVSSEFIVKAVDAIAPETYPEAVGLLIENLLRRSDLKSEVNNQILISIEKLTALEDYSWFRLFFRDHAKALNAFTPEQWARLLTSLRRYPRLDYHFEELLLGAADVDTQLVLDFLVIRVHEGRNRDKSDGVFDSHPRQMTRLESALASDSENVTKRLIAEYLKADYLGRKFYEGALLSEFVSLNSPTISEWLNSLADSITGADHELLLDVLQLFGNTSLAHPFFKRLIMNKRCDRKHWRSIASSLLFVESYCGDDGGLIQSRAFAENVSSWADDDGLIGDFKRMFADAAKTTVETEEERLSRERSMRALDYEMRTGKDPKKVGNG